MNSSAIPKAPVATRIARRFDELRRNGQMGLVAFLTAGDPSLAATGSLVLALAVAGADVIELGVPFSDPVADGPAIQRSSERALQAGTTLAGVLDLKVAAIRRKSDVPLVLFSYYNPVLQMGLERFAERAAAAGADGVLITDLTPEESADYRRIVRGHGLDTIFLAAPTSPDERLAIIAGCTTGFLYLISRTGVTGAKDSLPEDLPALVRRVRRGDRVADCGGLRDFAAGTSLHIGRPGRCCRGRLGAGAGDRAGRNGRSRADGGGRAGPNAERGWPSRNEPAGARDMNLEDWRRKIDEIDRRLVELLNERSQCVLEIGLLKKPMGRRSINLTASATFWRRRSAPIAVR